MTQEEKQQKLRLFDLSQCDEDIASAYKGYGILNYMAERPLLLQLSRDIRSLVNVLNGLDFKIQISPTDNGKKNSPKSDDVS